MLETQELISEHGRRPDVSDLSHLNKVWALDRFKLSGFTVQCPHGLFTGRIIIIPMNLEDIDVVCAQALQARLHSFENVFAAQSSTQLTFKIKLPLLFTYSFCLAKDGSNMASPYGSSLTIP
jgi:hypothetical protein